MHFHAFSRRKQNYQNCESQIEVARARDLYLTYGYSLKFCPNMLTWINFLNDYDFA